jgi:hypothetical protein
MTAVSLFLLAAVLIAAYYTVRRWVVLAIFMSLVSGELADPVRAKHVEELVARRDELENLEISEEERDRRLAEIEDFIARGDPGCSLGRKCLWDTAWEIYRECKWTKPKLG